MLLQSASNQHIRSTTDNGLFFSGDVSRIQPAYDDERLPMLVRWESDIVIQTGTNAWAFTSKDGFFIRGVTVLDGRDRVVFGFSQAGELPRRWWMPDADWPVEGIRSGGWRDEPTVPPEPSD
jgi:hypothetical protein